MLHYNNPCITYNFVQANTLSLEKHIAIANYPSHHHHYIQSILLIKNYYQDLEPEEKKATAHTHKKNVIENSNRERKKTGIDD